MTKTPKAPRPKKTVWNLCLYIGGENSESAAAFRNLKQICEEHLAGRYRIEVIDLTKNPGLARKNQIVALPTVVRKQPGPVRKVVGDLSNTARALAGLNVRADSSSEEYFA